MYLSLSFNFCCQQYCKWMTYLIPWPHTFLNPTWILTISAPLPLATSMATPWMWLSIKILFAEICTVLPPNHHSRGRISSLPSCSYSYFHLICLSSHQHFMYFVPSTFFCQLFCVTLSSLSLQMRSQDLSLLFFRSYPRLHYHFDTCDI